MVNKETNKIAINIKINSLWKEEILLKWDVRSAAQQLLQHS